MQQGFEDRNGERVMGMRDLMERLRQQRRERLEQHDLGGVYEEIAQNLREVRDMERAGLDELAEEARQSGDQRRDRRSAGSGRSVSGRVGLGGGRVIKKKKEKIREK